MTAPVGIADGVALAPFTTMKLGGPARHLVEVSDEASAVAVTAWARRRGLPLFVLGGGSNVVVADAGFDGVVMRMQMRGLRFDAAGDRVLAHVAAGESWDAFVATAVARGLAGIECLSGIPGSVGATPIQNVGAYGQEVAETIQTVRAVERVTGRTVELSRDACGFSYRDSVFKRDPDSYVVLGVTFALSPHGAPAVRYAELAAHLADASAGQPPTLGAVSEAVRTLRRKKSMVLDPADPNHRSVGSFFTNPMLAPAAMEALVARALSSGAAQLPADIPRFATADGRWKVPAAWLIEQAGFKRGFRRATVGLSSNHALALVHHGGGSTEDLVSLARDIRDAVALRFGVVLVPEPVFVGVRW